MKPLSWAARGLLAYIASRPPDWRLTIEALRAESPCSGRDALYGILRELIETGYITRTQPHVGGRAQRVQYKVTDSALSAFPYATLPKSSRED